MCQYLTACPDAYAPDRTAARVAADHLEQGWSLLFNGVVLFEHGGRTTRWPAGRACCIGRAPAADGPVKAGMTRMMADG
jgi:Family of unknown function (DUF5999)